MTSAWTETKQRARAAREAALASTLLALPDKQYGVLLADPGWRFEPFSRETGVDRAADNHYVTEPAPEIATLSVASIAARYRQMRELASCTFKISRAGMARAGALMPGQAEETCWDRGGGFRQWKIKWRRT